MIALEGISVRQGAFALDAVSFEIPANTYAVLHGPSGAGKTTLLETIAGLQRPVAGRVLLRGVDVTGWPPAARRVGYVPQEAALFTAMTVRENLGFALEIRQVARPERIHRVDELSEWLNLKALLERRAVGLSGGEAQRVAVGRALAAKPDVLLLDEPLSGADDATRDELLRLLTSIRSTKAATVLHVTHDRRDAEHLAEAVFVLENGRITTSS